MSYSTTTSSSFNKLLFPNSSNPTTPIPSSNLPPCPFFSSSSHTPSSSHPHHASSVLSSSPPPFSSSSSSTTTPLPLQPTSVPPLLLPTLPTRIKHPQPTRIAYDWLTHPLQKINEWFSPFFYPLTSKPHFEQLLNSASTYEQWSAAASILDQIEGRDTWKLQPESDLYDYKLLQDRYQALHEAREAKDVHRLIFLLRTSLSRNLGGIGNPNLYGVCKVGTKALIEDYISEVVKCLDIVCSESISTFTHRERMEFFLNTRQSFGRSALLLSGGATLALHHIGVIKCLWECKLLPRIISGASGGSIIASFICTHTEQEFPMMFNPAYVKMHFFTRDKGLKGIFDVLNSLVSIGALFNIDTLIKTVRDMFGDMTFLEAYNRSRRILNITVSSSTVYEMPRLLNYLTSPNVYIWSAVAASCSVPLIFQAAPLMAKDKAGKPVPWNPSGHRWIDGSVESDLPMLKLSELFSVNHFIVCQVNPHVVPFLHKGLVKSKFRTACESILTFSRNEFDLRCNQLRELGLLPELLYRVQSIVSQKYIGDITIIPEIQVTDYLNILNNPTSETYLEACFKGEKATWPKITIMQNHLRIEMTIDEMLYKCRMREWTSKNALQSAKRLAMQHANAHEGKVALKPRIKSTGQLRNLVSPNGQHPYTSQSVFYQKPKYSFTEKLVSASLGDLSVIKRVNELKSGSILPSNSNDKEMEMEKEKEKEKEKDRNGFSRRRSLSERYLEKEETDDLMFRVEGIPDASLPLTDKPPIMLPSSENPSLLLSTSPSLLISNPTTPPETPMLSHPSTPYNVIFE